MKRQYRHSRGVTLVELMVALAVAAILVVVAVPSFSDYRQRAVLRGAADQLASVWGEARFDALRRNSLVKVVFVTNNAGGFCVGTAAATAASDDVTCDCMTGACGFSNFPQDQSEWRRVQAVGNPTIGDTDTDASGVVVLDPKRGNLAEPGDIGTLSLRSPVNGLDYRLNFTIDRNGRGYICEPSGAANKLPQFTNRRC